MELDDDDGGALLLGDVPLPTSSTDGWSNSASARSSDGEPRIPRVGTPVPTRGARSLLQTGLRRKIRIDDPTTTVSLLPSDTDEEVDMDDSGVVVGLGDGRRRHRRHRHHHDGGYHGHGGARAPSRAVTADGDARGEGVMALVDVRATARGRAPRSQTAPHGRGCSRDQPSSCSPPPRRTRRWSVARLRRRVGGFWFGFRRVDR